MKLIPDEAILAKIYQTRGHKVMLDRDLAKLYRVENKRLKEQVRRNIERFPKDFMFELTKMELENWRSQFATPNDQMGLRRAPFVFTEHGVLMLSSVLNSQEAIQVNIKIMRVFSRMRSMIADNTELRLALEETKRKVSNNVKNIELVFSYLDELQRTIEKPNLPRKRIGYRRKNEE